MASAAVVSRTCGKQCMSPCCLEGASLPLYTFSQRALVAPKRVRSFGNLVSSSSSADLVEDFASSDASSEPEEAVVRSLLDSIIVSQWDDRSDKGLFRYDLASCETKVLPGDVGFVAQLNEGRHSKKRPTEFSVDQVLQPFDDSKFNFTKMAQQEVLFAFEDGERLQVGETGGEMEVAQGRGIRRSYAELSKVAISPNVVAINVSPIEYGHVLLIPRLADKLPQRIDCQSLLLALQLSAEVDNQNFRLGYNSLGAYATINHLHFQAYYLPQGFPIERASTTPVQEPQSDGGVRLSKLVDYPVRTLVFEAGDDLQELAEAVGKACMQLQKLNQPFNLFITDCGARVFLIPQCFAEQKAMGAIGEDLLETQVNPAVFEISGHIVLKRRSDYEMANEEFASRLLEAASLSEIAFAGVEAVATQALTVAMASRDHAQQGVKAEEMGDDFPGEEMDSGSVATRETNMSSSIVKCGAWMGGLSGTDMGEMPEQVDIVA